MNPQSDEKFSTFQDFCQSANDQIRSEHLLLANNECLNESEGVVN
jgi:hypothetical protein